MIKSNSLLFALFFSLFLFSCENDINLFEDSEPIPIVYGIYNTSNTDQLISVTKSFQFPDDGSSLQSASTEDSVYYAVEDILVYFENNRTGARVDAERVNLADEGVERQEGDFPTDPNYFYRYSSDGLDLDPGDSLLMRIEQNSELIASSKAPILPELEFIPSREPLEIYPFSQRTPLSFSWRKKDSPSGGSVPIGTYEFGFDINLLETTPDGDVIQRTVYFAAGRNLDGGSNVFRGRIDGIYDFFNVNLNPRSEGYCYTIQSVQMVITGGDESFNEYRELILANRSGLTSAGELPPFSNIEGAIGLFGGVTQLRQQTEGRFAPDAADELVTRCPNIDFGC